MIKASDALRLPCAQLTVDELVAVGQLIAAIEAHVTKFMERRGCEFRTEEVNGNVIAEVNQRLKSAGYVPQWMQLIEKHKLNMALTKCVGYQLNLAPSEAAYEEASAPDLKAC